MFEIDLFYNTFIYLFILILSILFIVYKIKKTHRMTFWFMGLFALYLLVLFKIVILPIRFIDLDVYSGVLAEQINNEVKLQLKPFYTIKQMYQYGNITRDILGNIFLLLPLPLFISFIVKRFQKTKVVFISLCFSFGIEVIQLVINLFTGFSTRVFDIDDIILNAFGVILGLGLFLILKKIQFIYKWISNMIVYVDYSNNKTGDSSIDEYRIDS